MEKGFKMQIHTPAQVYSKCQQEEKNHIQSIEVEEKKSLAIKFGFTEIIQ